MTTQANMDMSWFGEQLQKGRDELQADINTALGRTTQLEKALGHEQKARMELEVRLEKVRRKNSPVDPGFAGAVLLESQHIVQRRHECRLASPQRALIVKTTTRSI